MKGWLAFTKKKRMKACPPLKEGRFVSMEKESEKRKFFMRKTHGLSGQDSSTKRPACLGMSGLKKRGPLQQSDLVYGVVSVSGPKGDQKSYSVKIVRSRKCC